MSEYMNLRAGQKNYRRQLMATVSAMTLAASACCAGSAWADDADRPVIWLDFGAQLEGLGAKTEPFAPAFVLNNLDAPLNVKSPLSVEQPSRFAFGQEASLTFQPEDSDWVFSAGIRFGRANGSKHLHQQTSTRQRAYAFYIGSTRLTYYGIPPQYATKTRFSDGQSEYNEKHAILDFSAGKDVGLGMFGHGGSSVVSLGVRFAQFETRSTTTFRSMPDYYYYPVLFQKYKGHHASYYAHAEFSRSFRGIGPSISWTGSSPFIGDAQNGEVALDWGLNAALLFGRQKVHGEHQVTGTHFKGQGLFTMTITSQYAHGAPVSRSRRVTVPNLGGSLGLSFQFVDAKVSVGYRADVFFGAIDGGIDTRKSENRSFFGPYATISIGLGD